MKVIFVNVADTSRHVATKNPSAYPNLGILTLMSSVKKNICLPHVELGYIDGTIYGNSFIQAYVKENFKTISVICFSVIAPNYGASIQIADLARTLNPEIVTIFGNDHFSALYELILKKQPNVCYGFYGNDVVKGFTDLVADIINSDLKPLNYYCGLVYRDKSGKIRKNMENPNEYNNLSLVDYSLADSIFPHNKRYLEEQRKMYAFAKGRKIKSQVIDIGRGCVKFAGYKCDNIPINACDFCAIINGKKSILAQKAERAWTILKNAYDQGYNHFYITADELPLTLWNMLKEMADSVPDWFAELPTSERPKMVGYARAEAFTAHPERIDTMVDILSFNHFFIGIDGLSEISLAVMNKEPVGNKGIDLVNINMEALQKVVRKDCVITAGLVITHLGITPEIMERNYQNLENIICRYSKTITALDFGPLRPIPGSLAFQYLTKPTFAKSRAEKFGLKVNIAYLESIKHKYIEQDLIDIRELTNDFILGCCPGVSIEYVDEYMDRIRTLARKHSIAIDGGV